MRPSKRTAPWVPFKVESGPGLPESSPAFTRIPAWRPLPPSPQPGTCRRPRVRRASPSRPRAESRRQRPCPSAAPSRPGGGDAAPRAGSWVRKLPVFFLPSPSLLPILPLCFLLPPLLSFPSPPFLSLPLSSQGRPPLLAPQPPKLSLYLWH